MVNKRTSVTLRPRPQGKALQDEAEAETAILDYYRCSLTSISYMSNEADAEAHSPTIQQQQRLIHP